MLDDSRNNYLAAVVRDGDRFGFSYVDITTGEFATTQLDGRRSLSEELARLNPAEILLADNEQTLGEEIATVQAISRLPGWRFEEGNAQETLLRHFQVHTLAGYGCEGKSLAIQAAGAAIAYLNDTQRGALSQIQRLSTYSVSGYMALDAASRRNLELTEALDGRGENSLLSVLDKNVTAMGRRLMRSRLNRPLLHVDELNHRLDLVNIFFDDGLLRSETRALLKGYPDLERLGNRTINGTATPRDLEAIGNGLELVPDIMALYVNFSLSDPNGPDNKSEQLASLLGEIDPCQETLSLIKEAIAENAPAAIMKTGVIRPGFSAELDGVMNSSAHAREWVANLEPAERERTGISSLKVGFNKVFGYYIEVTKANAGQVPDDYIRKQTLTNAERYITPELKEYETLILNAEERILEIERRLFAEVRDRVALGADRLISTSQAIAKLDISASLAHVAATNNYVRPELRDDEGLHLVESRHPVVERAQALERFVPNDCHFDGDNLIQIITGPNMSGKSTYLRQAALIVLMAQVGSYVPAKQASIGLTDRIFTRIGAHDELHAGRSTFMVEMVEAAEILNHASNRSLLILDEIGRGTSTYDGLSIAWAMVEYLHNHPRLRPRTLFATHYHELTGLADFLPAVVNLNVAVSEEGEQVVFLHKIVPGGADRSYGIHVAQLAGLPRDVINRANEILKDLERHAPTAAVEPSHLQHVQQIALFPESSPILDELDELDVSAMTPLEAINKLFEWKKRYADDDQNPDKGTDP
jgi:DNA mismatch repair protein MutS